MRDDFPEEIDVQEIIAQAFATAFGLPRSAIVTSADICHLRRTLEEQMRLAAIEEQTRGTAAEALVRRQEFENRYFFESTPTHENHWTCVAVEGRFRPPGPIRPYRFDLAADRETRAAQEAIESADPMVSDDDLIDRMEETSRVLQEMAAMHGPARDADPQDEPVAPANPKLPIYRPR